MSCVNRSASVVNVMTPMTCPNASTDVATKDQEREAFEKGVGYVCITKRGFVPYNKNKINQDSFVCNKAIGGGWGVFGVLDGHGEFGDKISDKVAEDFATACEEQTKAGESDIKGILEKSVHTAVSKLAQSPIDATFSGTTFVASLVNTEKRTVFTANIGDSRAVLVRVDSEGVITNQPLSFDHKPDSPDEAERIVSAGGRVATLPGPPGVDMGPARVWLGNMDVPGLAMSRSIGDGIAHRAGVTDEPEITEHPIGDDDWFMVWASDGVWEFIDCDEVATLVAGKLPDLQAAAQTLLRESVRRWCTEEDAIDDITAVIFALPTFKNQEGAKKVYERNHEAATPGECA